MFRAERDATVAKIHAKEGDSLAVDAVILEFGLNPTDATGPAARRRAGQA